jgi:hypothetical protein
MAIDAHYFCDRNPGLVRLFRLALVPIAVSTVLLATSAQNAHVVLFAMFMLGIMLVGQAWSELTPILELHADRLRINRNLVYRPSISLDALAGVELDVHRVAFTDRSGRLVTIPRRHADDATLAPFLALLEERRRAAAAGGAEGSGGSTR